MRAVVCGGGLGGIAAALRLRARGYEVTLVERNQHLGGRARVLERGGFRHDAGPTVVTAPFLFEELFELFDERLEDHEFFQAMNQQYENGGREALLHMLLNRDISQYNVRRVPATRALLDQKIHSLGEVERFWMACLTLCHRIGGFSQLHFLHFTFAAINITVLKNNRSKRL